MALFTMYEVENVITEESSEGGDYASSEATPAEDATFREALDALLGGCWDNIDSTRDGTIIAYPADYNQNYRTGAYEGSELIITAKHPHHAERLLDCYSTKRRH